MDNFYDIQKNFYLKIQFKLVNFKIIKHTTVQTKLLVSQISPNLKLEGKTYLKDNKLFIQLYRLYKLDIYIIIINLGT